MQDRAQGIRAVRPGRHELKLVAEDLAIAVVLALLAILVLLVEVEHRPLDEAVAEVAHATQHLLEHLTTTAPPKDRETEAAKARARAQARYGAA